MDRYHIKTGFNINHIDILLSLTMIYNTLNWHYTPHCIDNIKNRFMEIDKLLLFIKNLKLDYSQIFEYYYNDISNTIEKICYRINYLKYIDIILVIGNNKNIITIYTNSVNDKHITLKTELYNKV